jgi:hypothetical protein
MLHTVNFFEIMFGRRRHGSVSAILIGLRLPVALTLFCIITVFADIRLMWVALAVLIYDCKKSEEYLQVALSCFKIYIFSFFIVHKLSSLYFICCCFCLFLLLYLFYASLSSSEPIESLVDYMSRTGRHLMLWAVPPSVSSITKMKAHFASTASTPQSISGNWGCRIASEFADVDVPVIILEIEAEAARRPVNTSSLISDMQLKPMPINTQPRPI